MPAETRTETRQDRWPARRAWRWPLQPQPRSRGTYRGDSQAMGSWLWRCAWSPCLLLEVAAQDRVDLGLIAAALGAEPLQHVGIEPQGGVLLAARRGQLRSGPVDLVHGIIGVASGR